MAVCGGVVLSLYKGIELKLMNMQATVLKEILSRNTNPKIDTTIYADNFNFLYSELFDCYSLSENAIKDIIYIESTRLKYSVDGIERIEHTPTAFIKQYSYLSFLMAQDRCYIHRKFTIANLLVDLFDNYVKLIDENIISGMEKEISDTVEDFYYASGKSKNSSMRIGRKH